MKQPTHVAVDIRTWKNVMDFLEENHVMKKVEPMVVSLRQGIPCNPEPGPEAQSGLKTVVGD